MLKICKIITNGIVYSNLWISLGAVAFSYVASVFLNYNLSSQFIIFIFSTTLFTYNFQRLVKLNFSHVQSISGPRADWVKNNLWFVYLLTILSAVIGLFYGFQYLESYALVIVLVGFFSFFYVWRLPFLGQNIRSIPGVKIYILSGTWVLATNVLPFFLFSQLQVSSNEVLVFFSAFLFVCAISIPFDIRDIEVDDQTLRTLPQILGVKAAIWLGILLVLVATLILVFITELSPSILFLNSLLIAIIIYFSDRYSSELMYSGLVDGTLIIWGLLVCSAAIF